ncbi:O-methyltransferase [Solirubrobacter ginsenosidimutans]|uniref:O-methyltransferase n=1 Tax=Solirubrobacter ginsenosidimutans TaxID=490573 RepID=A0A9X3MT00_9ACTN|nr:O-methyltransferase [Solirubrobacter ginsenosidimutans]MDA0162486.1 O-methyltransferase [Solirubrobacter ginsenosidimutans]
MSRTSDIPGLTDYLTRLAGQDDTLARVNRETGELPHGGMQSRPDQGALLTILAKTVGTRTAVEVGTFTGYGAICIARGLADGGRLTCFEYDPEYAEIARGNLDSAGVGDRTTIVVGPAIEGLATFTEEIDFAYVDADKPGYPGYYDALLPKLRSGGMMVLDNTLLGGRVIEAGDDRTRTMAELNTRIANDPAVDSVLIGLADGMTIVRKR